MCACVYVCPNNERNSTPEKHIKNIVKNKKKNTKTKNKYKNFKKHKKTLNNLCAKKANKLQQPIAKLLWSLRFLSRSVCA